MAHSDREAFAQRWSPLADKVIVRPYHTYAGRLEDPKTSRPWLATMPAAGGPVTRVVEFDATSYSKVRWSRDGKALIMNTAPGDRANLWLIPLDKTPPRRLTSFDEHTIFAFAPLADGKGWLLSRGELSRDAVLLTGFRADRSPSDP